MQATRLVLPKSNNQCHNSHAMSLPAPMYGTVTDFWRLVWQEKVQNIAMLTNLMEGRQRKCEQYWPESGSAEYGPFMVSLIEEQIFADYTIRTFHLVVRWHCLHASANLLTGKIATCFGEWKKKLASQVAELINYLYDIHTALLQHICRHQNLGQALTWETWLSFTSQPGQTTVCLNIQDHFYSAWEGLRPCMSQTRVRYLCTAGEVGSWDTTWTIAVTDANSKWVRYNMLCII